jgi:hypothetical protein
VSIASRQRPARHVDRRPPREGTSMHPQRLAFTWINLLGGFAVLSSYAWGFVAHPETVGALWGGVPEALRPL